MFKKGLFCLGHISSCSSECVQIVSAHHVIRYAAIDISPIVWPVAIKGFNKVALK